MINSINIGNLKLRNNIIQGPLAGYSCAPFRLLAEQFSKPGYCVTEMLSVKAMLNNSKDKQRYLYRAPGEGPLAIQLAGKNPQEVGLACKKATDIGADLIDLNCGCPQPKIRKKGLGSRLLEDPQHLFKVVSAMRNNTHLPISVKIRVSGKNEPTHHINAAIAAENAGADCIIVHGRHWSERYDTPCNLDKIAEVVSAVKIPVIANGDIDSLKSLTRTYQQTNCAGFMLARATLGKPWLIQNIIAEYNNEIIIVPDEKIIKQSFLQHIIGLMDLENEIVALLQARTLAKYYFPHLTTEQLQSIYQSNTFAELEEKIKPGMN